jgi:hypothetical protein
MGGTAELSHSGEKRKMQVLEWLDGDPCPVCGCTAWIIDGDGYGKFWLLCGGMAGKNDCVECKPLPDDVEVVE